MINRYELVTRHNPKNTKADTLSPFTVGNGEFAFTADITGLQTFLEEYASGIPLCTQSQWGWHSFPCSTEHDIKNYHYKYHEVNGRKVPYLSQETGQEELHNYLRENPHRLHLGKIGFEIIKADGEAASISDIKNIGQELNLWKGAIVSHFSIEGEPVFVLTCCDPVDDILAVSVVSPLLRMGRLKIAFHFSYGSVAMEAADLENEKVHQSVILNTDCRGFSLQRILDQDGYFVKALFDSDVHMFKNGSHKFIFSTQNNDKLAFCCRFTKQYCDGPLPAFAEVTDAAAKWWENFWTFGAAAELIKSKDPRAFELERRIVLSQYLTAVQCAGSLPPQETGLTCNSWYGKFHLEMHWWHAAHFPYWNRPELLERSLGWYRNIAGQARRTAEMQGYKGLRWPKMTSFDGTESPSGCGPYLIWQQPHIIYYAEQLFRHTESHNVLKKYSDLVMQTAEFMADYAVFDKKSNRYVLGPALIPAQENHNPDDVLNPTGELAYWHWGLQTAQAWRERLGLERVPHWDDVLDKLAPLPVDENERVYLAHEEAPDTYSMKNYDHPSMLYALGILPGEKAEPQIMRNTLGKIMTEWRWERTWGWDFAMAAMTATRLRQPDLAIELLLMGSPRNMFLNNGHNYQKPHLPLYLPGNGGLLMAVAMMCAGFDGDQNIQSPGFPKDGTWAVEWENMKKIL